MVSDVTRFVGNDDYDGAQNTIDDALDAGILTEAQHTTQARRIEYGRNAYEKANRSTVLAKAKDAFKVEMQGVANFLSDSGDPDKLNVSFLRTEVAAANYREAGGNPEAEPAYKVVSQRVGTFFNTATTDTEARTIGNEIRGYVSDAIKNTDTNVLDIAEERLEDASPAARAALDEQRLPDLIANARADVERKVYEGSPQGTVDRTTKEIALSMPNATPEEQAVVLATKITGQPAFADKLKVAVQAVQKAANGALSPEDEITLAVKMMGIPVELTQDQLKAKMENFNKDLAALKLTLTPDQSAKAAFRFAAQLLGLSETALDPETPEKPEKTPTERAREKVETTVAEVTIWEKIASDPTSSAEVRDMAKRKLDELQGAGSERTGGAAIRDASTVSSAVDRAASAGLGAVYGANINSPYYKPTGNYTITSGRVTRREASTGFEDFTQSQKARFWLAASQRIPANDSSVAAQLERGIANLVEKPTLSSEISQHFVGNPNLLVRLSNALRDPDNPRAFNDTGYNDAVRNVIAEYMGLPKWDERLDWLLYTPDMLAIYGSSVKSRSKATHLPR